MSLSKGFSQQPRAWIVAEMVAAVLIIGFLDYITGYEIRLLPFYCAPIFLVAWFCDRRLSLTIGFIAGVVSLAADWLDRDPDLLGWTQVWEVVRHLGSCMAVSLAGSALRVKSDIAAARISLLERSHRLEREIVNISEAEQRRIGQDLHDGLCQYLAALTCAATSLRTDLQQLHLRAEANMAGELAARLREAIVQTRDLARGLAPAHVSQVGLVLALDSLAQSVSRLHGVVCTFNFYGTDTRWDEATAVHLYRIAQEAINNATKHGQAKTIAVSLDATGEQLHLQIVDDGVGISKCNLDGLGLGIMRYRARLNGGELRIKQPQNGGTMVSCTANLNAAESESAPV